jgi:Cu/Ag efflux protein CusF
VGQRGGGPDEKEQQTLLKSSPSRPGTGLLLWLLIMLPATLSAACGEQPPAGKSGEPPLQAGTAAGPSPIPWKTIEPPKQVFFNENPSKPPKPAVVRTYAGTGVVTKVDRKYGSVEINHEEIKGLMPPMIMEWYVKNRSLLKAVRVGDRVNFSIEDQNGSEVISALKKAPSPR